MKRIIVGLLIFLAATIGVAQDDKNNAGKRTKPDLSGTWVLDKSRSGKLDYDLTLVILHREPEIKITRKLEKEGGQQRVEEMIYYTDGRVEWNRGNRDSEPVTRWSGKKLVRRSSNRSPFQEYSRTPLEIVTTEEWELSSDGKTLTRTVSNSGPGTAVIAGRGATRKYVFNRIP